MTETSESREATPFPSEGGLKLSFNKAIVNKIKAKPTKVKTHVHEPEIEKQYVTSLNEHKLEKLVSGPGKRAVVIPLLAKNTWKPEHLHTLLTGETPQLADKSIKEEENEGSSNESSAPKTLEEEAIEALKQESRNAKKPKIHEVEAIPLLVSNAVPGISSFGDEDAKFKHDLELRPDDVEMDAYDRVSIDDFGKGMLLGMGWRPGKGMNGKEAVEPIEFIPRAGRLGLGADPADVLSNKRPKKYMKPGETEQELMRLAPGPDGKVRHYRKLSERLIPVHSKKIKLGSLVEVLSGPLTKHYGRVRSIGAEDECSVLINITEQMVTLQRAEFDVIDEHALPKDHPAFKSAADLEVPTPRKQEKRKEPESRRNEDNGDRQIRRSDIGTSSNGATKSSKNERIKWLYPGLVVRVASQSLANGKYYNKKGTVEDVVSLTQFTLIMEDGQLVDDAKERHVQTALPKVGGTVRIVLGPNKGSCGELLDRNAAKEQATVQLDSDLSILCEPFDNVCEYKRQL
jgi:G patch domain/KOW motif-containing protein